MVTKGGSTDNGVGTNATTRLRGVDVDCETGLDLQESSLQPSAPWRLRESKVLVHLYVRIVRYFTYVPTYFDNESTLHIRWNV